MKRPVQKDVDSYLAEVASDSARTALERLRTIIKDEVPEAEEVISYGIPSFKYCGMLASFAAFKNHCSFFPGMATQDFLHELTEFKTATGTIQIKPEKPIPEDLLRRILRQRVASNEARHLRKGSAN